MAKPQKMPMRSMKKPQAAKNSPELDKAVKQLKKKPGAKLVSHPEFTAQQAKEIDPGDISAPLAT